MVWDNTKEEVDMMTTTAEFNVRRNKDPPFLEVELPYDNEQFSMVATLPVEGTLLEDVLVRSMHSLLDIVARIFT